MRERCAQPHHRCRGPEGRPCRRRNAGFGRDRHRVRRAGGRLRRSARRRTGHARDRTAHRRFHGRAHRCDHAVRRLGLRARRDLRRAGVAARTGPRLCHRRRAGADRAGRDRVRSAVGRRQELGPLLALSRARLSARPLPPRSISRSAAPAPDWRNGRQPEGRHRLGFGCDRRRAYDRRARGGQRGRHRHHRRRPAFLGGAVRAGRANSAGCGWPQELRPERACDPHQGRRARRPPPSRWSRPTRGSPRRRRIASR